MDSTQPSSTRGHSMMESSLSLPSTVLGHHLLWSFYGQDCSCKFPKKIRESLGRFRPENAARKALNLRSHDYSSYLIYTIKNLGTRISTCAECPMLYNDHVNQTYYPSPASKDHPACSHCLPLQFISFSFDKIWGS
jgi:hypothetical protein